MTVAMTAAELASLEPVAEIKFGQVGIANLKLKRLDPDALAAELRGKVENAGKLFLRAPVVLDLSHLPSLPDVEVVRDLLERIRASGMLPVGLSYGTSENERIAQELGIPVIAKFRASYERAGEPAAEAHARATPPPPSREPVAEPRAAAPAGMNASAGLGGLLHDKPVRSGQQVYARGRDLILTALVGNGAEVIADGSIHVYGALRGRALAGAQGDEAARIFCQEFHAELVSIAGQYRVFEDIPKDLRGQSVQCWLEGDKLMLKKL
ncbi:septum site-determining protein MinC [Dokdonella fugitiva]|uniref:septum site-determining protein MinC n=1 Tax=Dokdonella fugitiva TaxID=328517 RepID=UPI0017976CC1|nr:septum site-determining protein MinC [Dokdonella fugitiva]MBA8885491.1 septum site-determining protein MinC [Dokdonella fugitiva]